MTKLANETLRSAVKGIQPSVDPVGDLYYKKGLSGNSWFVTGHFDTEGHKLNFMLHLSILSLPAQTEQVMLNTVFSVTDETTGAYFSEDQFFPASAADFPDGSLYFEAPNYLMTGDAAGLRIYAAMPHIALELTMAMEGHALLNGYTGSLKMFDMDGFQYSLPTWCAEGHLTVEDHDYPVKGTAWLDRQYADAPEGREDAGTNYNCRWVWMGLNLDHGDHVSLWGMTQDRSEGEYAWATVLHPDGTQALVTVQNLLDGASEVWNSPKTGQNYPTHWCFSIPELDAELTVIPTPKEQEIVSSQPAGNKYEGASEVSGFWKGKPVTGYGYVELVGEWK